MGEILVVVGVLVFVMFSALGREDKKSSAKRKSPTPKTETRKKVGNVMDFDEGEYIDYEEVKS